MELLNVLVCLSLIGVASTQEGVVNPRGNRPVEHGTRSEKCANQIEWPICTDDEWGFKCPSGCRIQGLMDKYDHDLLKRIEKIRNLLDQNNVKYRSTDQVSKQTYDSLKDKLISGAGGDNNYYSLAQGLREKIITMKIKIDRQLSVMATLKDRIKDQVVQMQRLEVDIDIKLRSCKGSCRGYSEHQVDHESYVALEKQVNQMNSQSHQITESVGTLYVMKSRPLKDAENVDNIYKSGITSAAAAQQRDDIFLDVRNVHLTLEEEGSSSSPATISKVPVCMSLKQKNQDGRHSLSHTRTYRKKRCQVKSDVPLCSDDDWVSKCPSGCRLQGLISQMESETESKLWKVCKTAKMYEDAAEKSMAEMTHVYNSNRRVVVNRYMSELKFVEHAEDLARNLTRLVNRSSSLSQQLEELDSKVKEQIEDLYRTEVDTDMKLRACRGSCRSSLPFTVNHPSYQTLQTDVDNTLNKRSRAPMPPKEIPHLTLQPVDVDPAPSAEYKTFPTVQRELLTSDRIS
ncbi:fibrinogen alpha chain-like [Xiphias gladius]|uniref:fibrinogen alpha chain-like n=1 Tax=Xiphias gladius TaxID=8245 RepID=UPI001A98DCF3|nr:fibrinogen alpha chain-like [Xiphias gladius]